MRKSSKVKRHLSWDQVGSFLKSWKVCCSDLSKQTKERERERERERVPPI